MLMEVPDCFVGGYFSAGGNQFSPENRHNNGADHHHKSGEPFAIDDLLDFSNADAMIMSDGFFDNAAGNSTDSSAVTAVDSCNSSVSGGDNNHHHFYRGFGDPQLSAELCVPQYDDLAELEWLSNFVEDSFSVEDELKTLHILSGTTVSGAGTKPQTPESSSSSETIPPFAVETGRNGPIFHPETPLPGKARSKRTRAAPGDWSTRLLNLITPPPTATAATAVSEQAPANPVTAAKKRESSNNNSNSELSCGRKCVHCASEKTPQWRTGPMGPKTLCNACGVRYKSGRLVPEYRPAASPTFVSSRHSNSHRKVMEMRRQKEMQRQHHHQLVSHQGSIFGDEFLINHSNNGPDYRHMI